jgi:hypothetical protein
MATWELLEECHSGGTLGVVVAIGSGQITTVLKEQDYGT